jgi:hypothetical protein
MSAKHKRQHVRSRPIRQSSRSQTARPQPTADAARPWYKRASLWLIITITTGVLGGAASVIGTKLGDTVTAPRQPSGPPVLVSQVFLGPSDGSLSYAIPNIRHLSSSQLISLATSGYTNPANTTNFNNFIQANHGAPADSAGTAFVQLTFRGNRSYPVVITGMQVIKQCARPMAGTLFYSPAAGQGANAMIDFDLDNPIPEADTLTGSSYFLFNHITLNDTEDTQVTSVEATTAGSCSFRLVIKIVDGSATTYESIGDSTTIGGGPPFRVTRMIPMSGYGLVYVGGVVDDQCHDAWTSVSRPFLLTQPQSIVCNRT